MARLWPRTLLLVALLLSASMWTIPLSVPVADDLAELTLRRQIEDRVARGGPPRLPSAAASQVDDWIAHNRQTYEHDRATLAARYRDDLEYTGEDGVSRPYLGNDDSYVWLREARNYLDHGTTCDAVVDGECRDTYVYAPVGGRMIYNRSLHIAAIVGLHKLIRRFRPAYPLPATSMLVPIIVVVASVLPAFAVGSQLAGDLGGVTAAVVVSFSSTLFGRGFGSDNDAWNVALPLFMTWAAIAATTTNDARRQVAYALLAGAVAGLHAATWSGWIFTAAVLMIALLANCVLRIVAHLARLDPATAKPRGAKREPRSGNRPALRQAANVRKAVRVAVGFGLAAGVAGVLGGLLADTQQPYVGFLSRWRGGGAATSMPNADAALWPNNLATVSELQRTNLAAIIHAVGGPLLFFAAVAGVALLMLPRGRWRRGDFVAMLIACGLAGLLLLPHDVSRVLSVTMLTLVVGVPIAVRLVRGDSFVDVEIAAGLVIAIWLVASVWVAYGGDRFLLLLVAPGALAVAAAIGRCYERLARVVRDRLPRSAAPINGALQVLALALLIQPVLRGYAAASKYVPEMNDAWWTALTKIRDQSPADAIVNVWWDYGYWVKYVAERRVPADGSSLLTHAPYWIARALLADNDRESIGLLRMLDCGSDASPRPEGRFGAYSKILAKLADPVTAQSMVIELANRTRAAAATYLAEHGFTPAETDDVLVSTHCIPPEGFVVLSDEQTRKDIWVRVGSWDFRRAAIADVVAREPTAAAIDEIVRRFGVAKAEAATLAAAARGASRETFAMPQIAPTSQLWTSCRAAADTTQLHCTMALQDKGAARMVLDFVYDPASPSHGRLYLRGETSSDAPSEGTVATILIADAFGINELPSASPTYPKYAVLIDLLHNRVLIGSVPFIRSTFTRLFFLGGRYSRGFEKFDDELSSFSRVATWKIRWDEYGDPGQGESPVGSGG